ncbi:MAG TPA: sigma-54 dependent transcriptional regulator [Gemmatimonadales bacterium]|nr:sigma-54 dependent transcriptional regulator [Gemmatimonadales bacterium]
MTVPRNADAPRPVPQMSVVALSEAFNGFWADLASDLDVAVHVVGSAEPLTPRPDIVALVIAAGGAEREAIHWLATHAVPPSLPTLVVGTDPGRRTAMQLVAHGASDYFALPDDLEIFHNALVAAVKAGRARAQALANGPGDVFAPIVGESAVMRRVLERAARLLPHRNASALIVGETGTGKEVLARAIHQGGPRRTAPFVAVNCSALPEHLIESELFGHERGSFTDAHAAKPGLFEVADTGTLFLDEIGELPLGLQAKLLRALEDKEIRRVGGTKSRRVDVRILAATNDSLADAVHQGRFREDLFFRLSTVVLALPPLRERGDDLFVIAESLLAALGREHGLPVSPPMTPELRHQLRAYPWPGNVRELKNALERAILLSPAGGQVSADELLPLENRAASPQGPIPFPAPLHEIASAAARATVQLCHGNRSESARRLGISPRRLRRLLNGGDEPGFDMDDRELMETSVRPLTARLVPLPESVFGGSYGWRRESATGGRARSS